MNKQHSHFVREMREFSLLYEIDHNLASLTVEACLYDDYESFLPLRSNFVNDAPFIDVGMIYYVILYPYLLSFSLYNNVIFRIFTYFICINR